MNVDYACKLADSVMQRFPSASQYPYKDWSYPQGYLLIGFSRLWESAKDIRYRNYIDEYCRSHVTPEGEITGFKGNSRNGMPGQMWVDGVFMGQMFYCRYGRTFHETSCFDEAKRQIELIYQYCHVHDGLLVHAYSEDPLVQWAKEDGKSPCVWSEGLGWYALILSEMLDIIPREHPAWDTAEKQLLELLEGLLKVQDASGLWYQVVDRPGDTDNWCDVSGSAMFTYAFCHALRLGLVKGEAYEGAAKKGYAGIRSRMVENAEGLMDVYGACEGLCVQRSYEDYVYYPQKVNGQEAVCGCLWASIAMEYGRI